MDQGKWIRTGLILIALVLCCETSEIEEQLDTCVWVEVNLHQSHNSSELSCEGPEKPSNGGYVSDVIRERYNTGDTITYHCNKGHRLIGQAFRKCNGITKKWEPDEPYCEPEYIGDVMRRLDEFKDKWNVIEDKVSAIEQRITSVENNTLEMRDKMSAMEKEHQVGCTSDNKDITTMQLGVRNGHSVSVYKWAVDDYNSKVPPSGSGTYYSPPFYNTVPGYKFRLRGNVYSDSDLRVFLYLLPGAYDDQLTWPVSSTYELTVLMNDGSEVVHSTQQPTCHETRPTSATQLDCSTLDPQWPDVYINKKHILNDGSVVIKLYLYN